MFVAVCLVCKPALHPLTVGVLKGGDERERRGYIYFANNSHACWQGEIVDNYKDSKVYKDKTGDNHCGVSHVKGIITESS